MGQARHGTAWLGGAWHVKARQGISLMGDTVSESQSRLGTARHGAARQGSACQGKARFGFNGHAKCRAPTVGP